MRYFLHYLSNSVLLPVFRKDNNLSLAACLRTFFFVILLGTLVFPAISMVGMEQAHALVPSLHDDESDVNTPKWTHILRDKDGEGEEDDGGCPGNTYSEMPIGDIITIFLASGIFGGAVVLAGMVAAAVALMAATINIMEGIKVACPVENPEHSGEKAYWDRAWKDKIVFRYSPCIGILDVAGATGAFKAPKDDGKDFGGSDLGTLGSYGGYMCLGFRIGDGLNVWGVGHEEYLNGAVLGTEQKQDRICLYLNWGIAKTELVCQYLKPKPKPLPPALACFMPKVCSDNSYSKSRYPASVTGAIAQCVEGAVRALFEDDYRKEDGSYYPDPNTQSNSNANCQTSGLITKFHQELKRAVTGALTLYVIFYGLKIAFGGQQALSRGDFIMRILIFALVSYFAIGDGWKDYYPVLLSVSNSLASIVMDSSSGGYYCSFPIYTYPEGYEYLRLWDTLDCKVFSYFTVNTDYPKIFLVAVYTFLGGGVVILIFGIIMAIFLITIMIFILQIYLASVVGVTIMAFLSPLFVPLALFEPTRKYFSGWLGTLISFSMYPVVLFGFLALILVTLDMFYWGEPRVGDAEARNPKNYWRYAPDPDVSAFKCLSTGSAFTSVGECRKNCLHSECYLDESMLSFPSDGLWLCPISFHTYQGSNAQGRCTDQCYNEVDLSTVGAGSMDPTAFGSRLDESQDPPRLYTECVNGNYKPEFKAKCNATPDGPSFLTKEECEKPENCEGKCMYQCDPSTFGCQLYRAEFEASNIDMPGFGIRDFEMGTALLALLKVLGIGVLFYYYLAVIGPTIAELTGTHKLDLGKMGSNPKKIMEGLKAIGGGAMSMAKGDFKDGAKGMVAGAGKIDNA